MTLVRQHEHGDTTGKWGGWAIREMMASIARDKARRERPAKVTTIWRTLIQRVRPKETA